MPIKRSVNDGFNAAQKDFSRRDILILGAGAVAVSSTAFSATAQAAGEAAHTACPPSATCIIRPISTI